MTRPATFPAVARTDPRGATMLTDSATFRHVIGHFTTGVTVLTARSGSEDFGATASAVTSLSVDPPMLLVCLNVNSGTQRAIHETGVFGVSILSDGQAAIAERFARPRTGSKFAGLELARGIGSVPMVVGALASCECEVESEVVAGTHRVFLARVVNAHAETGEPLAYYRGAFGRFEMDRDRALYEELRRRLIVRELPLDLPLDLAALSQEAGSTPAATHYAVSRLVAEGLLEHDLAGGYRVRALTPQLVDEAFDARCSMELGVAAGTVGRVPRARVDELRRCMEETSPLVVSGRFTDVAAYTKRNQEFHEAVIALADNPTLSDAYRRLGVPGLMVSLLSEVSDAGDDIIDDHRLLVDAYARGDVAAALAVIVEHNEHAKRVNRSTLTLLGGRA